MQLAGAGRDLRDELDGACAGADNSDILAGKIDAVIPSRGMKRRTFETVETLELRKMRHVQRAHSGN